MAAVLAERGELSRGETRAHRLQLQKDLAAQLRRADRAKVQKLKEAIRNLQLERRQSLSAARELCRNERRTLAERIRAERRAVLEALRADFAAQRSAARAVCAERRRAIRSGSGSDIAKQRAMLAEERQLQREIRRAEKGYRAKVKARSSARERAQESDDQVRSNLPPELVPVFDRVRRSIKAGPRRTRTEAFLEWAEENPSEVLAIQTEDAERDVAELIREHEREQAKLERAMRRPSRYKKSPAQLERMLAEVPF